MSTEDTIEIIATRRTADGAFVYLLSDGAFSDALFRELPGGRIPSEIAWLYLDCLTLADFREIRTLAKRAKTARARRAKTPGELRAILFPSCPENAS